MCVLNVVEGRTPYNYEVVGPSPHLRGLAGVVSEGKEGEKTKYTWVELTGVLRTL